MVWHRLHIRVYQTFRGTPPRRSQAAERSHWPGAQQLQPEHGGLGIRGEVLFKVPEPSRGGGACPSQHVDKDGGEWGRFQGTL